MAKQDGSPALPRPNLHGDGRPTVSTVASVAAVSRQTVSNVINAPHRVREDTRRRVEAAIAQVGYRPLRAAQALRTRRSRLVAVGLRTVDGGHSQASDVFFHALSAHLQDREYRVLLAPASDDASEISVYDDLLREYDVEAVVLADTHPGDARIAWLEQRRVPFVTFGRPWHAEGAYSWVDVDGAFGVRAATQHLVDRGHRRVAFIGWSAGSGLGEDRRSGWEQACRTNGLATRGLLRRVDEHLEQGRRVAASLLDSVHPPTGIVCVSDVLALGVWIELIARGLVPGRDVAVVGFDDSLAAAVVGMTSVAQPLVAAARACVDCLTDLLRADRDDQHPPHRILLAPQLVVRDSG